MEALWKQEGPKSFISLRNSKVACARDIGVAFVSAPESEIATGCVSRHMPQFVLP